jgi:hypothetical protein
MYRASNSLSSLASGVVLALITAASLMAIPQSARAGSGAAFVGGLIGGHVLTNVARRSERRTQAAEYEAYSQPAATAPAPAAAAPSSQSSVQDRLDTLDKLAANGTITKEEYQQRRKAIIDGI